MNCTLYLGNLDGGTEPSQIRLQIQQFSPEVVNTSTSCSAWGIAGRRTVLEAKPWGSFPHIDGRDCKSVAIQYCATVSTFDTNQCALIDIEDAMGSGLAEKVQFNCTEDLFAGDWANDDGSEDGSTISSTTLIIIIAAVVVFLLVAGAAAWFMMKRRRPAPQENDGNETSAEPEPEVGWLSWLTHLVAPAEPGTEVARLDVVQETSDTLEEAEQGKNESKPEEEVETTKE